MQKTLTTLVAATVFGVSMQAHAVSAPAAEASIDWSNFTITLIDLDPLDSVAPALNWSSQNSNVSAQNNLSGGSGYVSDNASDWTALISAMSSPANASADSNTLAASIDSGSGYGYANASRYGNFTLSANTLVLFSAPAMVAISPGGDYAGSSINAYGVGAYGTGNQSAYSYIQAGLWSSPADSGILTTSFINLTSGNLDGQFSAYAYAFAPVPEPEAYAMMLAGLALVGWMARRRKA